MKKLLLALLFASFWQLANAQCTPDPSMKGLIKPPAGSRFDTVNGDPIVILPYAFVGQNYHEVLYFKIPSDTTAFGVTATINYVKLDTVLNMPANMSLNCNPSNCVFPGGSSGCASMDGLPNTPDSLEMRIAIEYNITISGLPTPIKDTLGGYYFVSKNAAIGLDEKNIASASKPQLYPNPASDRISIDCYASDNSPALLEITNVLGVVVSRRTFQLDQGSNTIKLNVNELKSGVYMYTLRQGGKAFSGRFTVSR